MTVIDESLILLIGKTEEIIVLLLSLETFCEKAIKAKALTEINNKELKSNGFLNMCLSILDLFWYSPVRQEIIPTI
jgi:hypothetical protein